jgi:putative phosphoesterase
MLRIGVLSDTHGLLRPEAKRALSGCDHILHAGDIGRASVLEELSTLAPVTAVRGNNDRGSWAEALPETAMVRLEEVLICLIHDRAGYRPAQPRAKVVVCGHSHKPSIEHREGVLFLNPGSAGPRRFKLPISMAELVVRGSSATARIVALEIAKP